MNKLKLHRGGCRTGERPDRVVSLACKFCEDGVCWMLPRPSLPLSPSGKFVLLLHSPRPSSLKSSRERTVSSIPGVSSSSNCDHRRLSRPRITLLDNARSRFAAVFLEACSSRYTLLELPFRVDYICGFLSRRVIQ